MFLGQGGGSVHEGHEMQVEVDIGVQGGPGVLPGVFRPVSGQGIVKVHDAGIVAVPEKEFRAVADGFSGHDDSPLTDVWGRFFSMAICPSSFRARIFMIKIYIYFKYLS
jgi:hypothetical protein